MKITNKGSVAQIIRIKGGSKTLRPGKSIEVKKDILAVDLEDSNSVQHYADRGVFFEGVKPENDPFKENKDRLAARKEREERAAKVSEEIREREAEEAEEKRKAEEKAAAEAEDKKKSEAEDVGGSTAPGRGGNAAAKG